MHKLDMDDGISKDKFLEWYRNPKNYRPELPSTNRSHKYEWGNKMNIEKADYGTIVKFGTLKDYALFFFNVATYNSLYPLLFLSLE